MPDLLDHRDAWNVAHHTAYHAKANLARCYIELRELARKVGTGEGPLTVAEMKRMSEIVTANDL